MTTAFAPKRPILAVAAALMAWLGAAAPPRPAAAAEIQWLPPTAYDAARAAAARQGQLIFVYVYGDNCPYCDMFRDNHLSDPAFRLWIDTLFQSIRINQSRPAERDLLEQLRWPGANVPRFYIATPDGRLVGRETGTAFFPPMKALDIFAELARYPAPFPAERLTALAAGLRNIKAPPDEIGRALVYAAMEALAWHWSGDPVMARRAFGDKFEPFLIDGPRKAPAKDRHAWDEIRLWYIRFWHDWVTDGFNRQSAARVAEDGARSGTHPLYARYAALLNAGLGKWDAAKRFAEQYNKRPESKTDAEFQRFNAALGNRR